MKIKKNVVALFLFLILSFNFVGSAFAYSTNNSLQNTENIEMAFGHASDVSILSENELEATEGEWWGVVRWVITRVVLPMIVEQCNNDRDDDDDE